MQQADNKITIAEVVYLVYFAVMFGARAVGLYEGMTVYNISLVAGMLIFLLKVICTEHTVAEYLFMGALLSLSLLVYYNTGEKGLLLYFTMMLGMKGVSGKRVEKLGAFILGIAFLLLTFVTSMGWVSDVTQEKTRFFFGDIVRHSLGYPHPNTLMTTHIILMVLCFSVLGSVTKKTLAAVTAFFLGQSLFLYIFSCSNTGLIVSVFFLAANAYLQLRSRISKAEKVLMEAVYPLCLVVAIILPAVTYPFRDLSERLRILTHGRWFFSQHYLMDESITLFGTRFEPAYWGTYRYMIDSSFLYSFSQIGLVAFAVVTVLNVCMIHDHIKKENRHELAVILAFCLLGLSDPFMFNLSFKNIMFLYIGEWIYRQFEVLCETHGDSVLQKKICIFRWGQRKVSLPAQSRALTGMYDVFCGKILSVFILASSLFMVVVLLLFGGGWTQHIAGRVDEAAEWDYFRWVLARGQWIGVCFMILFLGYKWMEQYRYDTGRK